MLSTLKAQLATMIATLHSQGKIYSGIFVGDGLHLLYLLFAINIAWALINIILDQDSMHHAVAKLTRSIVIFMFVLGVLNFWTTDKKAGDSWLAFSVQDTFMGLSQGLADKIAAVSGGGDAVGNVIDKMGTSIVNTLAMPGSRLVGNGGAAATPGAVDPSVAFCAGNTCNQAQLDKLKQQEANAPSIIQTVVGWTVGGNGVMALILSEIIMFGIAFILILCTAMIIFTILVGDIMIYVGLTFGPILLPFLLLPQLQITRQLPTGWFDLALGGVFYKAVALVIVGLASSCLDFSAAGSIPAGGGEASIMMSTVMMVFFAVLLKDMISGVGSIVSKLVGGASVSGGGVEAAASFVAGALSQKLGGKGKSTKDKTSTK
jgi:hypothetical protein